MAEDPLSQQREYARVPRDYLSQPVHSSARSIEERADGPPAVEAAHAPLASCQRTWTLPGADRRCHLNSRATRGGGRRSEEHTSELQSRQYLVCRLLLEKKKKTTTIIRGVCWSSGAEERAEPNR